MCVGDVKEESRHFDQSTVRQGRERLKMFLNLKCIFAPFAFVLFYYLHNYLKYKTLLFPIQVRVFMGCTVTCSCNVKKKHIFTLFYTTFSILIKMVR